MRKLPSIAAFLESAEWKSRIGADIIVDEYRADSDVFAARNIARDHTAAQSEEIFRKTRLLKARDRDRAKKLFQFVDEIGARAPRA